MTSGEAPRWPVRPSYARDLFAATAEYYAKFRVPYPRTLLDDLVRRAGIRKNGLLVDLACGTGEVAIPLSPFFAEVQAVDQEPEMVRVARRKSPEEGTINWTVGSAEDFSAEAGSVELTTIGAAFHRLDRLHVAEQVHRWLRPGCCIAVMGSNSVWAGTEDWQGHVVEVIEKWTGRSRALKARNVGPFLSHEEVLAQSGFMDIEEYTFPTPHTWSVASFIGYLASTATASKASIQGSVDEFNAEVRRTLLEYDESGTYRETMTFYYVLGRRP